MRNTLKIFVVIILTMIYCFGLFVVMKSIICFEPQQQASFSLQKIKMDFSVKVFTKKSNSLLSKNEEKDNSNLNVKNQLAGSGFISTSTEKLLQTSYKQYTQFFKGIFIRQNTSDLFFPFHYFW